MLLEKPMAVDERECEEIAEACFKNNTLVSVGHMMRYLPVCQKIKEIIDSGEIGDVVTIDHRFKFLFLTFNSFIIIFFLFRENINFWHFAHSYVRGNWRNEEKATFSLMAKSCHDVDLICYWLGDRKCEKVQSFGSLKHFKPEYTQERTYQNHPDQRLLK